MKYVIILFVCISLVSCSDTVDSATLESTKVKIQEESKINLNKDANKEVLPEGQFVSEYPNGNVKAEGLVVNGSRTGTWTSFHPNGNKQSENDYINGVLNGKTVVYHSNGQIMYIGYYKNGKYEGNWIYFTKEGEELKSLSFKNGKQL